VRSTKELAWLAGMVEGEGCIQWTKSGSPHIHISSTDKDVLEKCGRIVRRDVYGPITKATAKKPQYAVRLYGPMAASWMMTLYPMLGERRRSKVREVLAIWRARPVRHRQDFWIRNGGRQRATLGGYE